MHTDKLNVSMWRKSSQWVTLNRLDLFKECNPPATAHVLPLDVNPCLFAIAGLLQNRKHAALVAGDDEVNPLFVRECWVDTAHRPPHRFCVSDEHYIPTLLAAHGALAATPDASHSGRLQ